MTFWRRLTSWLTPAYDESRRRALIGAAALVSAPAIIKFASLLPPLERARASAQAGIYADLADIMRRAFLPRLYVQIYQTNPLLASLMQSAKPDDDIWDRG